MVTLDASPLFRGLKPDELAALKKAAQERSYSAGEEIFKEGDSGDGVYVVKEGHVDISASSDQKCATSFQKLSLAKSLAKWPSSKTSPAPPAPWPRATPPFISSRATPC